MNYPIFLRMWDAVLDHDVQAALRMLSADDEVTAVLTPKELVTHVQTIEKMQRASKLRDLVAVVGKTTEDMVDLYLLDEDRVDFLDDVGMEGDELRTLAYLLLMDEQYMARYHFCPICQKVFMSADPHEEFCDRCKLLAYRIRKGDGV